MIQRFVIKGWVPPPVTNTSRQRHWSVVRKEASIVKDMAWASAKNADWNRAKNKSKLTITLTFPVKRERDKDNMYARVKHFVDGLKPFLFEGKDDDEHLDLDVKWQIVPGLKQTEAVLEG